MEEDAYGNLIYLNIPACYAENTYDWRSLGSGSPYIDIRGNKLPRSSLTRKALSSFDFI